MKELKIFFAITKTSLYKSEIVAQVFPTLTKLASRAESEVPVGSVINNGTMLLISKKFILCNPEFTGSLYWGGYTTEIVALFLEKEKAEECFNSDHREVCDVHWLKETKEVLEAIGEDHTVFRICHHLGAELIPGFKI